MFKGWFSGRLKRLEFFWRWLGLYAVALVLTVLSERVDALAPLLIICLLSFACLAYGLGILSRRLRDAGNNPWLCLITLIPLVNFILLLYCFFKKSKPEPEFHSRIPARILTGTAPEKPGLAGSPSSAAFSSEGHQSVADCFSGATNARPQEPVSAAETTSSASAGPKSSTDSGAPLLNEQIDQLKDLQELKAMGTLSEAEFEELKKKILGK